MAVTLSIQHPLFPHCLAPSGRSKRGSTVLAAKVVFAMLCFGLSVGCDDGNRVVTPPEGAKVMTDQERDELNAKLDEQMLGVMADEPQI